MGMMKRRLESILNKEEHSPDTLTAQEKTDLAVWRGAKPETTLTVREQIILLAALKFAAKIQNQTLAHCGDDVKALCEKLTEAFCTRTDEAGDPWFAEQITLVAA